MRPVVIGVANVADIVNTLPGGVTIDKTGPNIHTLSWGEHALTAFNTGLVRLGKKIFVATGSKLILVGLAHLGADIRLWKDTPAGLQADILATGIKAIKRNSDDAIVGIVPPVVFAGDNPIAVGLDGAFEDGETYRAEAA